MHSDETTTLRLVPLLIEIDSDPISGSVAGRDFTGWAQLAAAIETAARSAPSEGAGPPT